MTAATGIAAPARSPWFRSPAFDLLLILAVPFATWPLVFAGQDAFGPEALNRWILLTATGHYFATFVRTYGDRDLFSRFKTRFVVAPLVLLVVCVGMFASDQRGPLLLVTTGWAFWHWLAQAFGFARIYDSKVGSFRPLTAWLDKALVVTGFVATVILNPASTATFGKVFLDAGIPLPSAAAYAAVRAVVFAASGAVLLAYAANLGWTIARGLPWSWQKQFMHATTIGYYWFAFAWLPNVLVAYVLYELFHDIQYYAITWLTCRQRVQRPGVQPWLARMFRPGTLAVVGFVLVMSAFGALDAFGRGALTAGSEAHDVWLGVFLTAALLHYYYDGFVWKAREQALGRDLGIHGGLRAAAVPALRHAGLWSLFFVPMLATTAFAEPITDSRQRAEALVAVAPGDFLSRTELAFALVEAGDLPGAVTHYRASVAANPDFAPTRANFGAALELAGDLAGARAQYEAALRCRDGDGAHARAAVNLGVLLLLAGERAAAEAHFRTGRELGGEHPIGRMLALAAAVPSDDGKRRMQLYAGVLQLDANQLDARFHLGNLLQAQQQFRAAAEHFAVVARLAPDFVPGQLGLASALVETGQFAEAKAAVQRALQREPGNAAALALQQRLRGL